MCSENVLPSTSKNQHVTRTLNCSNLLKTKSGSRSTGRLNPGSRKSTIAAALVTTDTSYATCGVILCDDPYLVRRNARRADQVFRTLAFAYIGICSGVSSVEIRPLTSGRRGDVTKRKSDLARVVFQRNASAVTNCWTLMRAR